MFLFLNFFWLCEGQQLDNIGTFRQELWVMPEISGIKSSILHSIQIKDLDTCDKSEEKITNEIYKPVWQFGSRWSCVFRGD